MGQRVTGTTSEKDDGIGVYPEQSTVGRVGRASGATHRGVGDGFSTKRFNPSYEKSGINVVEL
jgi:hypothetical protein